MENEHWREYIIKAIHKCLIDIENGVEFCDFSAYLSTYDESLYDPANIDDIELNAIWNYTDYTCFYYEHKDDGWENMVSKLREVVEKMENNQPITDPIIFEYADNRLKKNYNQISIGEYGKVSISYNNEGFSINRKSINVKWIKGETIEINWIDINKISVVYLYNNFFDCYDPSYYLKLSKKHKKDIILSLEFFNNGDEFDKHCKENLIDFNDNYKHTTKYDWEFANDSELEVCIYTRII